MFRKLQSEGTAPRPVRIFIDGDVIVAEEGEPVAAVMLRLPSPATRTTPVTGAPGLLTA